MTRIRAALLASALATTLLLAACTNDAPEPSPTTPEPTGPSARDASPEPTGVVAPPVRPSDMDDDGPAGAEAAAVYFLELDDYIMKTGDTAEWEAMSHKTCGYCANRLEQAQEIKDKNYTWASDDARARVVHTYEQDATTGIWPIDVEVDQSAVTMTNPDDDVVYSGEPEVIRLGVEIGRQDGRWVVIGVRAEES
jgi:hypothetical protein